MSIAAANLQNLDTVRALSSVSKKLLRPVGIGKYDRLRLSFDIEANKFLVVIHGVDPISGLSCRATWAAEMEFPRRIFERKELRINSEIGEVGVKYAFACTDVVATTIATLWPAQQIEFEDDITKTMFQYLGMSGAFYQRNAEVIANYKLHGEVPGEKVLTVNWETMELKYRYEPQFEQCQSQPLLPYQQVATHCAITSEAFALFMQQGTGKTPVAIAAMCNKAVKVKAETKRMYRALIVCPKNVRTNWVDEIDKFKTCEGKVTILRGGQIARIKLLLLAMIPDNDEQQYTMLIVSYETMTRMIEQIKQIEWDMAILDEGHFIKSNRTKRAKASMVLRESAKQRMLLTGTPVANSPLDVYSQLEFLGKGWSGFQSWDSFKDFYGVYEQGQHGSTLVGLQNMPFMRERLAARSFIITKEEALPDLPDKVYDIWEVVMTPEQRDCYNTVRKDLMYEIEQDLANAIGSNKSMVINNVLTKMLRLAQITSGFVTWDAQITEYGDIISPKTIEFFMPNAKVEALMEILAEKGPNDKTIVWACWVPDIKAIMQRLEQEGIKAVSYYGATSEDNREIAKNSFNEDREVKVFVGNPGAGGTGLNLLGYPPGHPEGYDTNANHVIYFSQDWSHPKRAQSEDRAHRRGTREPIRITDLCVAGSIDEEIRTRVLKKRTLAFEVSDVKDILQNVLRGVLDDDE